jgi:hypothetical protein
MKLTQTSLNLVLASSCFLLASSAFAGLPAQDPVTASLRAEFVGGHTPTAAELAQNWQARNCEEHSAFNGDMSIFGPDTLVSTIYGLGYTFTPVHGTYRLSGSTSYDDVTLAPTGKDTDGLAGSPDYQGIVAGDLYGVKIAANGDLVMEVDLDQPSPGFTSSDYAPSIEKNGSLFPFAYTVCPQTN